VSVTAESSSIVGWPGLTVPLRIHVEALPPDIPVGAEIGVLRARAIRRLPSSPSAWPI
jgi:hypothetical protein